MSRTTGLPNIYSVASEIAVTAGATQAIITIILAVVHAGDEVIVLEPCYDSYVPNIGLAGGVQLVADLQAWLRTAEAIGNVKLHEFAAMLRAVRARDAATA